MKIVILNTLYHPYKIGGAEVSVQLLAESLADTGHSVSVISLHEAAECIDHLNGVTLYRLPLRNLYWPFSGNPSRPRRLLWHLLDIYNPLARADVSRLLKQISPMYCTQITWPGSPSPSGTPHAPWVSRSCIPRGIII